MRRRVTRALSSPSYSGAVLRPVVMSGARPRERASSMTMVFNVAPFPSPPSGGSCLSACPSRSLPGQVNGWGCVNPGTRQPGLGQYHLATSTIEFSNCEVSHKPNGDRAHSLPHDRDGDLRLGGAARAPSPGRGQVEGQAGGRSLGTTSSTGMPSISGVSPTAVQRFTARTMAVAPSGVIFSVCITSPRNRGASCTS